MGPMPNQAHKVVYKPDSQSTDEFIILIDDAVACEKWIAGDKTIALANIVGSFDIFHTGTGAQGLLQRASKQELDSVFESHNENVVVETILSKGNLQACGAFDKLGGDPQSGHQQMSRGSTQGGR